MDQKSRTKLLEVFVEELNESWRWSVHFGQHILGSGVEKTSIAARFAGNDALFKILASPSGWDE
jgi:hypothetical protein